MRDTVILEDSGIPTATVISTTFAPLARVVAVSAGHSALPIIVVPHPVGDPDERVIARKGEDIAAECARVLTSSAADLEREFRIKSYPLPNAVMPR